MLAKYKNILYVSDLNPGSRPAFRAAVSLAIQYEAKLTYLHVLEKVSGTAKSVLTNMMDKQDVDAFLKEGLVKLREKAQQRLENFCVEELEAEDKLNAEDVNVLIKEGNPWKRILQAAEELKADVIVMGTRRSRGLDKIFLGSTASRVLSKSKIPVLIIPLKD